VIKRLRNNFEDGIEKIKWFASLLSDRLKIELSVMKLLHESEQMEKKRDELVKKIGQRVLEMREHAERQVLKDSVIMDTMNQIEKMDQEIEETRKKASEISSTVE
jgi:predicted transcriptional regulator